MGIPYPCFYGDVINKVTEFKSHRSKLENLIRKVYDLACIIDSLWHIFVPKNVGYLQIRLVGPKTSN